MVVPEWFFYLPYRLKIFLQGIVSNVYASYARSGIAAAEAAAKAIVNRS